MLAKDNSCPAPLFADAVDGYRNPAKVEGILMSLRNPFARTAVALAVPVLLFTSACQAPLQDPPASGAAGATPSSSAPAGSNGTPSNGAPAGGAGGSAPANGAPGKVGSPGSAVNLSVTPELRAILGDLYFKESGSSPGPNGPRSRSQVIGPKNVFYGKIAGASPAQDDFWALGDTGYQGDPVSQQDGPHVWHKRGDGAWDYIGDTGGGCGGAPKALVRLWNKVCN
jgi:hypothetical protein